MGLPQITPYDLDVYIAAILVYDPPSWVWVWVWVWVLRS